MNNPGHSLAVVVSALTISLAALLIGSTFHDETRHSEVGLSDIPPHLSGFYFLINSNKFLRPQSKLLYSRLIINQAAWDSGLIDDLKLNDIDHDPFGRKMISWSNDFQDDDGRQYRVYLLEYDRPFRTMPPRRYPITCVVTTDEDELLYWKIIAEDAWHSEEVKLDDEHTLTIQTSSLVRGDLTYRYHLTPESISLIDDPLVSIDTILKKGISLEEAYDALQAHPTEFQTSSLNWLSTTVTSPKYPRRHINLFFWIQDENAPIVDRIDPAIFRLESWSVVPLNE